MAGASPRTDRDYDGSSAAGDFAAGGARSSAEGGLLGGGGGVGRAGGSVEEMRAANALLEAKVKKLEQLVKLKGAPAAREKMLFYWGPRPSAISSRPTWHALPPFVTAEATLCGS